MADRLTFALATTSVVAYGTALAASDSTTMPVFAAAASGLGLLAGARVALLHARFRDEAVDEAFADAYALDLSEAQWLDERERDAAGLYARDGVS